jgi:prophage tail gpP-like protein
MPSRILITDRNNVIISSDVDFSEYVFEIDTFNIANPFDMTLANLPDVPEDLDKWYGVTFIVETKTMFRGVIQRRSRSGQKGSIDIRISGKNRGSILVESSCTSYKDFRNKKPKDIIEKLIQQTNFYSQPVSNAQEADSVDDWDDSSDIDGFNDAIDESIRDNKAFVSRNDRTEFSQEFAALPVKEHFKIEPGDNVFDKINELTKSQGFDVVYQPNGVLFFGDISKKRLNESPQIKHKINLVKRDRTNALQQKEDNNNILTWDITEDTSSLYSSVTVVSQSQNGTNKSATATDSTVLDKKALVQQINDDDSTPQKEAIRIREDNRINSFNAFYTAPDHIDDVGEPWGVNRTVDMNDTFNGVTGEHVLYGTTFTFSRQEGFKTELNISYARRKALKI